MCDETENQDGNNARALYGISDGGVYCTIMGEVVDMAYKLRVTIDELMQACDTIHDELCIGCPIESECLREASAEEVWNSVSEKRLQEFIDLADKIKYPEEVITHEDRIAYYADMERKRERDEADW